MHMFMKSDEELPEIIDESIYENIMKTRLFKHIENFTTKTENFQIKH